MVGTDIVRESNKFRVPEFQVPEVNISPNTTIPRRAFENIEYSVLRKIVSIIGIRIFGMPTRAKSAAGI